MKPKILIFIDWYKPGFKAGGPIVSISNLVSQLHAEYDFYIVTRNTDYLETTPYANITANTWQKIDNANVYYLDKANQNKSVLKQLITEVKPDCIYCNSLYSPIFTLAPIKLAKRLKIPAILAVRGMLSSGSLSVKSTKKKAFIRLMKITNLFSGVTFHATSNEELNDIKTHFGTTAKVVFASNLPAKKDISHQTKLKEKNQLNMVFVGRIAPEKNVLYGIHRLKACTSSIVLDIYGPIYNEDYHSDCLSAINQLPSNIVVNYKGILEPHLLDETLKDYHVLYAPSTGENFGHSIIEGMMNSCVPVISDKTPWINLQAQKVGYDIALEATADFSKALDQLAAMSEEELGAMSLNAHNFAQAISSNKEAIQEYQKLFHLSN